MAANDVPCCETMFWVYLVTCIALVAFAGLMSGLTLGLMSLSIVDLEILIKAGRPDERRNAEKILPIVRNQHLLLCTLLICNALAMEALPVFVDSILPAWGAVLISVTLILAFGEIIPQAVCSKYGLSIGARLSVVVRLLVIIVYPLAYPISKLLDRILGERHSSLLRRAELKTFVDMHGNEAGNGGELTHEETTIITGALDLTKKTVKDAMTPLTRVFSLDLNSKLDDDTMSLVISKGHSRVPVYSGSPGNIVGLLLVKNLIKCRPEDKTPIRNLIIRGTPRFKNILSRFFSMVHDCLPLYDLLNQFQKGHSHMAVVVKSNRESKNIIENAAAKPDMMKININYTQTTERGTDSPYGQSKQLNVFRFAASPVTEEKITSDSLESSPNIGEEAIGIITMEDVLEQLLQEPIFDETDDYVDIHNKIKINMLRPLKIFTRSPGTASTSHPNWRTPVASPYSSSHQTPTSYLHTPILHSPISPYVQSPLIRPTLCVSPGKFVTNAKVPLGSSPSS